MKTFLLSLLLIILCFNSYARDIKKLQIGPKDFVYLEKEDLFYATVSNQNNINYLLAIDPYFGKIVNKYFIGNTPGVLAVSNDEAFIYIGSEKTPIISRFNVQSKSVDQTIQLGGESNFLGPNYAEEIQVMPGFNTTIAVSLRNIGSSPRHMGVVLIKNGVIQELATPTHTGSNSIAFTSDPNYLYGYNNETTDYGFRIMKVSERGLSVMKNLTGIINSFYTRIISNKIDNTIFSTQGHIITVDSISAKRDATIAGYDIRSVVASPDSLYLYVLTSSSLRKYKKKDLSLLSEFSIETGENIKRFICWGKDEKLAFTNGSTLTILRNCESTITSAPKLTPVKIGKCNYNDVVVLTAEQGYNNYFWSNGDTAQSIQVANTGYYSYSVADAGGCLSPFSNSTQVFNDYAPSSPYLYKPEMTTICIGEQVELASSYSSDNYYFEWSNGATTSKLVTDKPGTYYVYGISAFGCKSSKSNEITITQTDEYVPSQPTIAITGDTVLCSGESATLTTNTDAASYNWSNGNSSRSIDVFYSGIYTLTVSNKSGCKSKASEPVEVKVYPTPSKPYIYMNKNILASNYANGNQWFMNNKEINNTNEQFYYPTESGIYAVQVTLNGCTSLMSDFANFFLTDIDDQKYSLLKSYPNPTHSKLHIETNNETVDNIEVYNSLGNKIYCQHLDENQTHVSLDLSNYKNGIYLLHLSNQGRVISIQKIIKY